MSRSSVPLSMPMPHIQLKSTAFRSLAFAAGVYGAPFPAPGGACAVAVNGTPIARTTSAILIQLLLRRESMAILPLLWKLHAEHLSAGLSVGKDKSRGTGCLARISLGFLSIRYELQDIM